MTRNDPTCPNMHRVALALALALAAAGCAARPQPLPAAGGTIELALGQAGAVGTVAVTPLRIEEDSRCPEGVQCIQAGTVRLSVRIADGRARRQAVMTLGLPLALSGERSLTLCAVAPHPVHPVAIEPAAYRFGFALRRDAGASPPDSACTGR